ncbi:unnamed protein product [Gongylonema pulchrum]|uniref:Innexin n=1 Tax=Gongylonema pulchrum TaxID=637853 RepID=A0A183EZ63_9BILA|nr:unnamed protein product [Gongylonema pulchrum]
MYIDLLWVIELLFIVFFTSFSLYATYLLPIQYCDLIHRCATHLGKWDASAILLDLEQRQINEDQICVQINEDQICVVFQIWFGAGMQVGLLPMKKTVSETCAGTDLVFLHFLTEHCFFYAGKIHLFFPVLKWGLMGPFL